MANAPLTDTPLNGPVHSSLSVGYSGQRESIGALYMAALAAEFLAKEVSHTYGGSMLTLSAVLPHHGSPPQRRDGRATIPLLVDR